MFSEQFTAMIEELKAKGVSDQSIAILELMEAMKQTPEIKEFIRKQTEQRGGADEKA